jgi:hypothetical protein
MKIEKLRKEKNGNRSRVAATVSWEDCDRPQFDLFFETEEEYGGGLSCNPHAFIVGSILPAMYHGETRIAIDGEICPELREGLITVMNWVRHWYFDQSHDLVRIDANIRKSIPSPRTPERTGFFFSGGIDSYGTLCENRLNYPAGHPGSIRDGLLIYGQNIESDNRAETFSKARSSLSVVASEGGFNLIPVYTNIRLLEESGKVFTINHGAILAAVAHAFSQRLTNICVSSSDSIPGLRYVNSRTFKPLGSHPLLDPNYSSSDMRIRHNGITLSRLDKTKLIDNWGSALRNIKVCGPNWPGENCGKCEKCVRTMLALLAAGVLDRSDAFPLNDISADLIDRINIKKPVFGYAIEQDYRELIEPFRQKGRLDLVNAVEQAIKRCHSPKKKKLVSRVREMDRKYLSGLIAGTKKRITMGYRKPPACEGKIER